MGRSFGQTFTCLGLCALRQRPAMSKPCKHVLLALPGRHASQVSRTGPCATRLCTCSRLQVCLSECLRWLCHISAGLLPCPTLPSATRSHTSQTRSDPKTCCESSTIHLCIKSQLTIFLWYMSVHIPLCRDQFTLFCTRSCWFRSVAVIREPHLKLTLLRFSAISELQLRPQSASHAEVFHNDFLALIFLTVPANLTPPPPTQA